MPRSALSRRQPTTVLALLGSVAGALVACLALPGTASAATQPENTLRGHDVSAWQEDIDWKFAVDQSAKFVFIKATEDDDYSSSQYSKQWAQAAAAGLYRGSYHFARPFWSDGASQAKWFLKNTYWRDIDRRDSAKNADGKVLPPVLDLEHKCSDLQNSDNRKKCEAITPDAMIKWIGDFVKVIESESGVKPIIYTTKSWWDQYTGGTHDFADYPLWHARWKAVEGGDGPLPGAWKKSTFWQHHDNNRHYAGPGKLLPGDQNLFFGDEQDLDALTSWQKSLLPSGT